MQTDLLKIKTTLANRICHIRSRSILKLVALASCLMVLASAGAAPAVQPCCVDFNDCPTGGGFSGFSGQGANCDCGGPGPSGNAAADFCFECADGFSSPSFITAASSFYGDWTGIANNCGEFCYDFQLKNDGDGSTHASIVPNFDLIGPGGKGFNFTLTTPTFVTEVGGANPGWHSICAPIAPLQSGNLPTISGGFWTPLAGTANSDWPAVLADVTSIHFNFDQTPFTEDVCLDNVCLRLGPVPQYGEQRQDWAE